MHIANCDGHIVMDFFAGASPMAEAVFRSNLNGKHIRFIQIQLPERSDEDSEAKKGGLNTISDIAKERIRRVSKKIQNTVLNQLDLHGRDNLDLGFKVLKLNISSLKRWRDLSKDSKEREILRQMELSIDHIDPSASQEDILYELLLKAGIKPTETIVTVELTGHKIFSVADGALLVHLENTIDKELIDAVLEQKPEQFICLDRAFHGNDQLKANAVKTFETYNKSLKNEDTPIVFRTV